MTVRFSDRPYATNYFRRKVKLTMRFILGVLWGYYIQGRKRLLIITLTVFTVLMLLFCVVIPAIALSILGLSVMRERASRPPQTSVPSLVGLNYESAETKVRESNLNIRILAHRYDVPNEPCTIIFQTPQTGERVSYGAFVGVVISNREGDKAKQCSSH
jgi:PASTA domain-containing protein